MHIARELFPKLLSELDTRKVTILLGPRQVGKTYLLKWLKRELDGQKISCAFFNLEDPEHLRIFSQSQEQLYRLLTRSGRVVFIDEFHYLKNASQLFKAVYDSTHRVKIFASGSSSIEIHKHLKESLAGRRHLIQVPPLSYPELMNRLGSKTFDYYFRFGGLPGVAQEDNQAGRITLLNDILQAYLLKDVKALIKEENIRAFNMLLYLLAQSQGSVVSVDELARQIGLTSRSIHRYLDLMNYTYVLGVLPSYSRNLGNELKKSKKYYLYDIGIRNALLKDFRKFNRREDKGCLLESAVFLHLFASLRPNEELRFWRTRDGREVDFILVRDRQPIPIEVKVTVNELRVPSGMQAFLKRYPHAKKAFVVSTHARGNLRYQKTEIHFAPWHALQDVIMGASP